MTTSIVHLHSSPLVIRNFRFDENGRKVYELQPVDIIGVKREIQMLKRCLRESNRSIHWRTEVADPHTFRKALTQCHVLHFSGHGIRNKIVLENGKCEAQLLSETDLSRLLKTGGSIALKLVFISACHSESIANAFVDAGVPHVVVVSKEDRVLDEHALNFAQVFYSALFNGHTVQHSFDIGCTRTTISSEVSLGAKESTFKLLGYGNHGQELFQVPFGEFLDLTPSPPKNEADSVADFFVGRSIEVHKVYSALVEGSRMVTITGAWGIGKSQVALQCAQYATDRYLFRHIHFIDFKVRDIAINQKDGILLQKFAHCFGIRVNVVEVENQVEILVERVRKALMVQGGKILLLLDGCDFATSSACKVFTRTISSLLRRVPTLSLLLTRVDPVGFIECVGERVVNIERMSLLDSAVLLALRSPRRLLPAESGGSFEALSEHPATKALQGHPRTICRFAQELSNIDLTNNLHDTLRTISLIVNETQHKANVGDDGCATIWEQMNLNSQSVRFECIQDFLCEYFARVMQSAAIKRPLSSRALLFF